MSASRLWAAGLPRQWLSVGTPQGEAGVQQGAAVHTKGCPCHSCPQCLPSLGLGPFSPVPCPSLAAGRKSLTYFNHDPRAALQEATFDLQEAKKIFFGSFHKVLGTAA
jgi:hypothetical protein